MWLWIGIFLGGYLLLPLLRDGYAALNEDNEDVDDWLRKRPYHIIAGFYLRHLGNGDDFMGASIISWLVSMCGSTAALIVAFLSLKEGNIIYTPSLITTYGLGCASYLGLALTYNWLPAWCKKRWAKELTAYRNWQKERLNNPLKQGQHFYQQLENLLEGKDQQEKLQPVLRGFHELVQKELPRLIKRQKQLEKFIEKTKKAIARQKGNGICKGEEPELKKASQSLKAFEDSLSEVKNMIDLLLSITDLAKAEIGRIIDAINARDDEKCQDLIQQIEAELALQTQTEAELKNLRGKYSLQDHAAQVAAAAEVQATLEKVHPRERARA